MPTMASELLPQQQQPPVSPVALTQNQSHSTAPSPCSEASSNNRSTRIPLTDNDLLGLQIDRLEHGNNDDDTARSSSDETPVYTVEGKVVEDETNIFGKGQVPLIYGYLRKLSRNSKWSKRFFETNGESLSYYKSEKRSVKLASLDLRKVGSISIDTNDQFGCTFCIQVSGRPYLLKAESKQSCIDWVITLNRVKEARLQVGGVKLVSPRFQGDDVAPRVVLKANRARTRAVDDEQQWRDMTESQLANPTPPSVAYDTLNASINQHLTEWHKPRNTYYRVKQKLVRWARSIKQFAATCTNPHDQVVLDNHLHPPGHDNIKTVNTRSIQPSMNDPVDARYLD